MTETTATTAMTFEEQLRACAAYTEGKLEAYLPERENAQKEIYTAMRYSLLAGGKRIRPTLAYAAAAVLGLRAEAVAPFACAIEMIHTYSLIHDDLPAMDNDDYRRGRLSCHKKFGEALAILAGDALLTAAFELSADAALTMAQEGPEQAQRGIRTVRMLAQAAGADGMVGGQVLDLQAEREAIDGDRLHLLCALKTGKLLTAPVLASVLCAGASDREAGRLLVEYAQTVGLAFQIKDDILDVEGDAALLGKATGMDSKDNKTTFVTLYGLEGSKARLTDLTAQAVRLCDRLEALPDTDATACRFLRRLAVFLLERNH